jgi:hypothetical protein
MKTAKLTWLFIGIMIASITVMPAPVRAETKAPIITIEIVRSEVNIPDNYTFPYINIWRIWCMTPGIEDWAVATNLTRADLADVEVPDGIDSIMFKFFVEENLTGYYINPYYLGDQTPLDDGDYGYTSDGDPYINATAWGPTAADVYDNSSDWYTGPIIDWFGGIIIGGTEQASQRLTYTAVQSIPMGRHTYFMSGFTKDCVDDGEDRLVEQWLSTTDYIPMYLYHPPEAEAEEDEPLSLVFGLLALIAVSMITMIRKKK